MKNRMVNEPATPASVAVAQSPEWVPAMDHRLTVIGTRILIGADAFFYAAFFFAFFYLRAMNNNNDWMTHGVTQPSRTLGALIALFMIVTAVLYVAAMRNALRTTTLLWVAFVSGLLAIGFQVYEYQHLGFDPQQGGGYPSVFIGLTGSLMIQFAIALVWLVTHIAQAGPGRDLVTRRATAVQFGNVLLFLAGISLITYLVLFFV